MSNEKIAPLLNEIKKNNLKETPFPLNSMLIKGKKGAFFGLKGQGKLDFVKRCIEDGMGWKQIGRAIGWIDFAIFECFYNTIYEDIFDSIGVSLINTNKGLTKNWAFYDLHDRKIKIYKGDTEFESLLKLSSKVKNIQFIIKNDKLLKKYNNDFNFDFHLVSSNNPNNIKFHSYLKNKDEEFLVKNDDYYELIIEINELIREGYKFDRVYFDICDSNIKDKCFVNEEYSNNVLSLLK